MEHRKKAHELLWEDRIEAIKIQVDDVHQTILAKHRRFWLRGCTCSKYDNLSIMRIHLSSDIKKNSQIISC